jgi:hypothetical protein
VTGSIREYFSSRIGVRQRLRFAGKSARIYLVRNALSHDYHSTQSESHEVISIPYSFRASYRIFPHCGEINLYGLPDLGQGKDKKANSGLDDGKKHYLIVY